MQPSDIISLVALTVAITSFVVNLLHTNRAFRASSYPTIRLDLGRIYTFAHNYLWSYLYLRVYNESKDIAISHISVILRISESCGAGFHRRRWILYGTTESEFTIAPNKDFRCEMMPNREERDMGDPGARVSFERFVAREFPSILKREENPNPSYRVLRQACLDLLLEVRYKPSVFGARACKIVERHEIRPVADSVAFWDKESGLPLEAIIDRGKVAWELRKKGNAW
jgi:hypothetical protein